MAARSARAIGEDVMAGHYYFRAEGRDASRGVVGSPDSPMSTTFFLPKLDH
jgi:hypothetical protein